MKITYYGHSAVQIEAADQVFLFDPFISGNPLAEGIVKPEDLSPTVVLLSHAHGDHYGDAASIVPRSNALLISNYEICVYLSQKTGYENYHPMNSGGSFTFDWGSVKQTYARHSSSFPDGTYGGNPNGFLLFVEGKTIYFAGDTDVFAEMAYIGEDFEIDLAILPIGDNFTMGHKDALRAAKMLNPKQIMPVHYNTFGYIVTDTDAWQALMQENGFATTVLAPGGSFSL